jgi:hypothetical protein
MIGDALVNWFFLIVGLLVLLGVFYALVRNLLTSPLGGYSLALTAFLLAFGRIWTARGMLHNVAWFVSTLAAAAWSAAGALALIAVFRHRRGRAGQSTSC